MYRILLLAVLFVCSALTLRAQTIEELNASIKKAEQEIAKGNQLLKINEKNRSSNLEKIVITRNNIKNREKIVADLNKQTEIINRDISKGNDEVNLLSKELSKEKRNYSRVMLKGYKNYISNSNLLFLFSAVSFQDLQVRIYYLRRYGQMKINMAKSIEKKSAEIVAKIDQLSKKRDELQKVTEQRKVEIGKLEQERKNYNNLEAQLKKENSKLNSQIRQSIDKKRKLEKQLAEVIAEEARRREREKNKLSAKEKSVDIALSNDFAGNKGKLPLPVDGGTVVEQFGTHKHPLYPSLVVTNNGVDIAFPRGGAVKSVFNGVVVKVFFLQGLNNSIIVRHGEYLTVYSGLDVVYVKTGDAVKTGQTLGKITDTPGRDNALLHFELLKGLVNYDPEEWLR